MIEHPKIDDLNSTFFSLLFSIFSFITGTMDVVSDINLRYAGEEVLLKEARATTH